ncbi:MAG TPA: GGDEF domain-containing protein [Acidimicrobiales bacterium]|nr:GGDEF domain-containing protein [Acidimicrobiales bacterium]
MSYDAYIAAVSAIDPAVPLAVAAIDVDRFDLINDREGFAGGDAVLRVVEDALLEGLPGGALLGHVKGDEWAAALPDATAEELLIVLDGIRRQLAATGRVTIAGGIAGRPPHGTSADDLLAAADGAQVRAKEGGGNRMTIAAEEKMVLKSSYYTRASLRRLSKLAERTQQTEAHHLRQALDDHLARHRDLL